MRAIVSALDFLSSGIANLSTQLGREVNVKAMRITDREGEMDLAPPGTQSPNGSCRLVRARDGWLAVNLARQTDYELVPAWLSTEQTEDVWNAIDELIHRSDCAQLVEQAALLGLPVAHVGETKWANFEMLKYPTGGPRKRDAPFKVIDLSALWAGPLCGAVFARMGASVTKIESISRPDPTRHTMPDFDARLNGQKRRVILDLGQADHRIELGKMLSAADLVITGARPRALDSLGLLPSHIFEQNPGLVWIAITGHSWFGPEAQRVAFGDDAAAAGGLVSWLDDTPRFLGDALADPVAGLVATWEGLTSLMAGGGELIDVSMARCASAAARYCGIV